MTELATRRGQGRPGKQRNSPSDENAVIGLLYPHIGMLMRDCDSSQMPQRSRIALLRTAMVAGSASSSAQAPQEPPRRRRKSERFRATAGFCDLDVAKISKMDEVVQQAHHQRYASPTVEDSPQDKPGKCGFGGCSDDLQ